MRAFPAILFLGAATLAVAADKEPNSAPRLRPADWATPLIATTLGNCYRVSDDLYRCEQPHKADIADLHALGIRTILNLRHYHSDAKTLKEAGFTMLVQRMDAGEVTVDDLVAALRQIRAAPKPVMVHCWHGSDRTGSVVAAYRIVFQNWTREQALDKFRHGGFGYHERWFPGLVKLIGSLDEAELRRRVLE